MIILAIADRRPTRSLIEIVCTQPIDVICTLGDLEYSDIKELAQITHIPKLGVYGNHCTPWYFTDLGIQNMHLQTQSYQGLVFGWFEWCVRYKPSSYAKIYTQEESQSLLSQMPKVDIMLCHCPPYGINDDTQDISHTGFLGLKEYMDNQHPKHLLHGHTYPHEQWNLTTQYHTTAIHYVYEEKVVVI